MSEERKFAILFAATFLSARKLALRVTTAVTLEHCTACRIVGDKGRLDRKVLVFGRNLDNGCTLNI
ncbi:MAG: hypothetical protein WB607_16615 [Candidatus Acidiferrum sp.]|jgi:hypothetical protein